MSEFTDNNRIKIDRLMELAEVVIARRNAGKFVKAHMDLLENVTPSEVVVVVHKLVDQGYDMEDLKYHVAKMLNLFYKSLNSFDSLEPEAGGFLFFLQENARVMDEKLKALKPIIQQMNKGGISGSEQEKLAHDFTDLQVFIQYFILKENLLFPLIESHWEHFKCVQVMWSIHDDIRKYLKILPEILRQKDFDLHEFNVVSSKLYFDFKAIKFRDEKILYHEILMNIPPEKMDKIFQESLDMEFPFIEPEKRVKEEVNPEVEKNGMVNLATGSITPEQILMIFNHLPVDLTYVDENDKVMFYSTPKHRIFPRTNAVLGRKVSNCHPPESVHIVERIVDAFRKGEKDEASFWIKMGPHFVLIKYFAVRDASKKYRGVLEVSQEVSDIRKLEGEQRLLDWE